MYVVTKETLTQAHKPFDIVRMKQGEIAFIQEVGVNECQPTPESQISYSLKFITPNISGHRSAWYRDGEFEVIGNMFTLIAEAACHNAGHNGQYVEKLLLNK